MQLLGREDLIADLIEATYQRLIAKHANKAVDERAETHLQAGAQLREAASDRAAAGLLADRQILHAGRWFGSSNPQGDGPMDQE